MAIEWTLSRNGEEPRTFAQWGLARPMRRLYSQAPDIFTFSAPQRKFDDAPVFEFGDIIRIYRDDVQWFFGRVNRIPRYGSPAGEGVDYEIVGPWWWLDHIVYQLTWVVYGTDGPELAYKSHVFLNKSIVDAPLTTAEQIADVIAYATTQADPVAPIVLAAGTPALNIPVDEVRDVTCGEVIRKQLRWMPDAVTWFDYSTEIPTLHIRRRAALEEVILPIVPEGNDGSSGMETIEINPRYDLQVPSVALTFEKTNSFNDVSWNIVTRQIAPDGATGREAGALVATVDLMGMQASVTMAEIETRQILPSSSVWWKEKQPVLSEPNVLGLTITNPVRQVPNLANEITDGTIAPWMQQTVEEDSVSADVSFTLVRDPSKGETEGNIVWKGTKKISVNVRATNAVSGTYQSTQSFVAEEPEPAGLAAAIYDGLKVLHFEGEYSVIEEEVSGIAGVGNVLSLVGSRPEWTGMKAVIQTVIEEMEDGRTTFVFGPPAHLAVPDFLELLRVNRNRFVFNSNSSRTTGQSTAGAGVTLGKSTAKENTSGDNTAYEAMSVKEKAGEGTIILDSALTKNKVMKPREMEVCIQTSPGVYEQKKVLFIASEPYT